MPALKRTKISLAAVLLALTPITLLAGECPTGQSGTNNLAMASESGKAISVTELASLDLANEAPALDGRQLRIRTINFQPGGYVPLHSHDDRPALAMVTQGELIEYTADCKVPITHKTGDIIVEKKGVTHWVVNRGDTPAVLTVSDIPDNRIQDSRFK